MPANLTPEYQRAEQSYREARTPEQRLAALELMLATIPKHKGTDKMQGDIKRRIARLRAEDRSGQKARHVDPYCIEPSGAGQVVLIGMPNVGKSTIVQAVTNAHVLVADYPFATPLPVPGMAKYEDVQIQLVDMPPYTEHGFPPGMVGAIRKADVILIVIDGSADPLEQLDLALGLLAGRKIVSAGATDRVPETPDDDQPVVWWEKHIIVVVTKIDLAGEDVIGTLSQLYGDLEFLGLSATAGTNIDALVKRAFQLLNVVRVYAKPPGKKPDLHRPFVLKSGSTLLDMASEIHRDFADRLRFARVWGTGKYPGQQVAKDYILSDKDVLEIHI